MCDFEEFIFSCGHNTLNLQSYCHQTRNHPRHECENVKRLRNSWYQQRMCNDCARVVNGNNGDPGPSNQDKDPRGPFVRRGGKQH